MAQEYKGNTSGYDIEGIAPIKKTKVNPYANVETSLCWKGGKCKKANYIGRVTIGTDFIIEFTITIHGKTGESWESILHIGHENMERSPGIWFHPKSYKLNVRLSDVYDKNKGHNPAMELEKNGTYHIKFQCIEGMVSLYIDNKLKSSAGDIIHYTRFASPVWCSDPWHDAANVTIRDLNICGGNELQSGYNDAQSIHAYNPEIKVNVINVLAINHAHGPKSNGKYFHFDKKDIEEYLLRPLKSTERFKVRIQRTNYLGNVIFWASNNGGSRGNAHGRFDKDPIGEGIGYFKIGDKIEIIDIL